MSGYAIQVEGLGKRYRIGNASERHDNIRDALTHAAKAPFRSLKQLRKLSRFEDNEEQTVYWALRDLSFEVRHGEVLGIIGRNGAGKSTLLKVLSRITEPTTGRVRLEGRVGSLLEVGTGFHPELTGRENVYLNGSILGMDRPYIDRRFDEIVSFSGVEAFLDTPVKRYSSGMYLRLAFAVAAHLEPEILVVDEVLAVGDAEFQKKCLAKMGEVAGEGRTVLLVSHNMAAVANLCTRGLYLNRGQVASVGRIDTVIQDYLSSTLRENSGELYAHAERRGRGRVRFTAVEFEDESGRRVENAVSGRPLAVVLRYRSVDDRPLWNCRFSVAITDGMGQALINCSSELTSDGPLNLPSEGSIRCVLPRLPLSGSQYLLSPFLEVDREIEDWVEGAVAMNVTDGDFFGTGKLYPEGWQGKGVLVDHQWIVGEQ